MYNVVTASNEAVTWAEGWCIVDSDARITGKINCDGAKLTLSQELGVEYLDSDNLTIYAQSRDENNMGVLNASGTSVADAIKANDVTINGGSIITDVKDKSGIVANNALTIDNGIVTVSVNGNGLYAGKEVTINGGNFTVGTAQTDLRGISAKCDLTINNNAIGATAENNQGYGLYPEVKLTVDGGTVTATNGTYGFFV